MERESSVVPFVNRLLKHFDQRVAPKRISIRASEAKNCENFVDTLVESSAEILAASGLGFHRPDTVGCNRRLDTSGYQQAELLLCGTQFLQRAAGPPLALGCVTSRCWPGSRLADD